MHFVNAYFDEFRKLVTNPFNFRLFLLKKLPAAFFAGLSLERFEESKAIVSVKQKWFNKNPFGSIYFAVLTMAAEMSTGILCMANIYKRNPSVSMLVVKTEATFYKKATGKILFTCNDGAVISEVVQQAIASGDSCKVVCTSVGTDEAGETVALITCTWSFKTRAQNS